MLTLITGTSNKELLKKANSIANKRKCEVLHFPENGLHPKWLMKFVNEIDQNKDLVIITHSDFIILTLNLRINYTRYSSKDLINEELESLMLKHELILNPFDYKNLQYFDFNQDGMRKIKVNQYGIEGSHSINMLIGNYNDIKSEIFCGEWIKPETTVNIEHNKWYTLRDGGENYHYKILNDTTLYNDGYLYHHNTLIKDIKTNKDLRRVFKIIKFNKDGLTTTLYIKLIQHEEDSDFETIYNAYDEQLNNYKNKINLLNLGV